MVSQSPGEDVQVFESQVGVVSGLDTFIKGRVRHIGRRFHSLSDGCILETMHVVETWVRFCRAVDLLGTFKGMQGNELMIA